MVRPKIQIKDTTQLTVHGVVLKNIRVDLIQEMTNSVRSVNINSNSGERVQINWRVG